jgi:hypothetical protein
MNFTVGVAGRGAVTIGFKGFGSFMFYFTLTLSDKRGIIPFVERNAMVIDRPRSTLIDCLRCLFRLL